MMKGKRIRRTGNFPRQTHFVGVLVPQDIALALEDCRRYMRETCGCKSGHGTPPHVTLVPPFCLHGKLSTEDLALAIEAEVALKQLEFTARIDNFDAFGDRTLFARVVADARWGVLRDAVYAAVNRGAPGCAGKAGSPLVPHLTVANRDVPAGAMTEALQVMSRLNLVAEFPVDNVTIFQRQGGGWVAGPSIGLSGGGEFPATS